MEYLGTRVAPAAWVDILFVMEPTNLQTAEPDGQAFGHSTTVHGLQGII